MTVMLTGASGFVGRYMQEQLDCISLNADLRDVNKVAAAVKSVQPDIVIHLAAKTFVPASFADPRETFDINFIGTLNLLNALKLGRFRGIMLYVGSGDMYGLVSVESIPITEDVPLKPRNPYSVSKVAAEALCFQWGQTEDFSTVLARPFNHIGPGQSEMFVISDFAKQIAEIKLGLCEPVINVGDIDVTRDFTDVRDVVRAYSILVNKGVNGEVYNVCSGRELSIRSLLEQMLVIAGVSATIKPNDERFRSAEQRRICGSNSKINLATGWFPEIEINTTLGETIDYWLGNLK